MEALNDSSQYRHCHHDSIGGSSNESSKPSVCSAVVFELLKKKEIKRKSSTKIDLFVLPNAFAHSPIDDVVHDAFVRLQLVAIAVNSVANVAFEHLFRCNF